METDQPGQGVRGVAALMTMPRDRSYGEISPECEKRLLLLYQVGNPSNLGAILRSAHWFGVKTVLISEGSVDFTHPKVIRGSMGSLFHLEIMDNVDFRQCLPDIQKHYTLLGTTVQGGVSPHPVQDKPSAISWEAKVTVCRKNSCPGPTSSGVSLASATPNPSVFPRPRPSSCTNGRRLSALTQLPFSPPPSV